MLLARALVAWTSLGCRQRPSTTTTTTTTTVTVTAAVKMKMKMCVWGLLQPAE
jgi:hypothetical protein